MAFVIHYRVLAASLWVRTSCAHACSGFCFVVNGSSVRQSAMVFFTYPSSVILAQLTYWEPPVCVRIFK